MPEIAHLDQTWGQRVDTSSSNVAIRDGKFRYIQFQEFGGQDDPRAAVRLDPGRARADRSPGRRARDRRSGCAATSSAYLATKRAWEETKPLELDEMQLNQLRAARLPGSLERDDVCRRRSCAAHP
jgi:hypothetical protein